MADVLMIVWGTPGRAGGLSTNIVPEEQCEYVQGVLNNRLRVECIALRPPLEKPPKK